MIYVIMLVHAVLQKDQMHVLFEMELEVYTNTHVLTHAKIIIV